jgi:hypothetical protein
MKALSASEMSVYFYAIHGAISQKAATFMDVFA